MLVLIGRTCSGKDTILKEITKLGLKPIVSYTTRPMRDGEVEGINYHYIDKSQFRRLKLQGFFAETTSYNVATGATWYYGSAKKDMNDDAIVILNPEGLRALKENKDLNIVSFLVTAKDETLRERLAKRGDNPEEAERRLKADAEDFSGIEDLVDYTFANDTGSNIGELSQRIYKTYLSEIKNRKAV
jgi:guanylate kinase